MVKLAYTPALGAGAARHEGSSPSFRTNKNVNLKLGIYRHYKGNLYEVLGEAKHSETLEPMIVYRAQYGDQELWVRPFEMFVEEVLFEGTTQPRFQFLEQQK